MKIKINTSDLYDLHMESAFPKNYRPQSGPVAENHIHMEKFGNVGTYRELYFEGIRISYGDLRLKQGMTLHFETDFETIEMLFDLTGQNSTSASGYSKSLFELTPNQHNIIYTPAMKGKLDFNSQTSQMMEINMSPQLFSRYVEGSPAFDHFLEKVNLGVPALLYEHNMPITPDMQQAISGILNCNRHGVYKRLYIESKVVELLMLQLEQYSSQRAVQTSLKVADMEKLHRAHAIVASDYTNVQSLKQLALEVGTNEFILKKGFRELFGTTVFGMVHNLRMERAKTELQNDQMRISEVSELSGYHHQTHFTSAFKKKFGLTPKAFQESTKNR